MIILLPLSILNVNQDEWALNYGKVTRQVRGSVLGPGRYTLQPDSKLITYKNTFVPWELIIDCWTSDGLDVTLDITIQTRYIESELETILFEFGDEDAFKPYVENILKKLLRESCSNFTSFDYYNQRGTIQSDMLNRIDKQLPRLGTHITSGGYLQLRDIKLPALFNQAILDKRSAEQDISVAVNQRAQQLIIANTNLSQANNIALITINNATQQAAAILFGAEQRAIAIRAKYDRRLQLYQSAMASLNMNASSYIKYVLYNRLIAITPGTTVFV
jgi:hypothetical protein